MLCENCKNKNATSFCIDENTKKLKYLCGECYRNLNREKELERFAYAETLNFSVEATCKECGTTFNEFKASKLFGCANCYKAFDTYIYQSFLPNFKEQKYLGKKPNAFYIEQEIKNLEQLIEISLKNKNFNQATKYGVELQKLKEANYGKL